MLELLDKQNKLTSRQLMLAGVALWAVCLEFLDYFLIGFILTFVSVPWKLTFGESAFILLSSGVGAILGAMFFGRMADRIGRRKVFLTTIAVFTLATLALVFTPEGTPEQHLFPWLYLVIFRVVIGFGAGGLYVVDLPLVQEYMPVSQRGRVTGIVTSAVPLGFLLGSLLVWLVSGAIGWRGILVVAAIMGATVFLMRLFIPESPRYLIRNGELEKARQSIAWALHLPVEDVPATEEAHLAEPEHKAKLSDLWRYQRSFWTSILANIGMQTGYYGLTLWTPTLLVLLMGIDQSRSGFFMVFVTLGALTGRFGMSFLSEIIGRKKTGMLTGFGAAAMVVVAALVGLNPGAGFAFFVTMIITYFFGEGGFAIVGPYSGEVWPSKLRTTGMGFAYGIGGIGKIIGPLGLGLILGAENLLTPKATQDGLLLGFGYFAVFYLLVAIMIGFIGFETRRKSIEVLDHEIELQVKA